MNIDTMQMDPRIARIHYLDYRKKVREHRDERKAKAEKEGREAAGEAGRTLQRIRIAKSRLEREDEELMKAYREMSLGARLINLTTVMLNAGIFPDSKLPKLAIAQANWKDCFFTASNYQENATFRETRDEWSGKLKHQSIHLPRASFPAEVWDTRWRDEQRKVHREILDYPVKAIIPSIPVHLRPAGDLGEYCILWEAVWTKSPPVDPLLLKQVGEFTYAILAQWDLTPIERSILTGRIT